MSIAYVCKLQVPSRRSYAVSIIIPYAGSVVKTFIEEVPLLLHKA